MCVFAKAVGKTHHDMYLNNLHNSTVYLKRNTSESKQGVFHESEGFHYLQLNSLSLNGEFH